MCWCIQRVFACFICACLWLVIFQPNTICVPFVIPCTYHWDLCRQLFLPVSYHMCIFWQTKLLRHAFTVGTCSAVLYCELSGYSYLQVHFWPVFRIWAGASLQGQRGLHITIFSQFTERDCRMLPTVILYFNESRIIRRYIFRVCTIFHTSCVFFGQQKVQKVPLVQSQWACDAVRW